MSIFFFILAGLVVGDVLFTVSRTGKDREPISGGQSVWTVLQYGAVVWLLVWAGLHL